jgi:hypothetical protein
MEHVSITNGTCAQWKLDINRYVTHITSTILIINQIDTFNLLLVLHFYVQCKYIDFFLKFKSWLPTSYSKASLVYCFNLSLTAWSFIF